jgi:hypothetical protein
MFRILKSIYTNTGTEPLTLEQAKEWLRVTTEDEDTLITGLISTARGAVEAYTGISIIDKEAVIEVEIDKRFRLPYPQTDSIQTVERWNGTTFEEYNSFDTIGDYFVPKSPGTYRIEYTTIANQDPGVLQDVKRVLLWQYENRGDALAVMPKELMSNAKAFKILVWE